MLFVDTVKREMIKLVTHHKEASILVKRGTVLVFDLTELVHFVSKSTQSKNVLGQVDCGSAEVRTSVTGFSMPSSVSD